MPQIPGATKALSSLVGSYLLNDHRISPAAQQAFENELPKPFRLTRDRFDSDVNVIKESMGQGGAAKGEMAHTDEAVILVKAKL